jgi:hypothetical protein
VGDTDGDDESDGGRSPVEEYDEFTGKCDLISAVLCGQITFGILSVLGYERTATFTKAIDPTAAGGK